MFGLFRLILRSARDVKGENIDNSIIPFLHDAPEGNSLPQHATMLC